MDGEKYTSNAHDFGTDSIHVGGITSRAYSDSICSKKEGSVFQL